MVRYDLFSSEETLLRQRLGFSSRYLSFLCNMCIPLLPAVILSTAGLKGILPAVGMTTLCVTVRAAKSQDSPAFSSP